MSFVETQGFEENLKFKRTKNMGSVRAVGWLANKGGNCCRKWQNTNKNKKASIIRAWLPGTSLYSILEIDSGTRYVQYTGFDRYIFYTSIIVVWDTNSTGVRIFAIFVCDFQTFLLVVARLTAEWIKQNKNFQNHYF